MIFRILFFVLLFCSELHAQETFKGFDGVTFGMSPQQVIKLHNDKNWELRENSLSLVRGKIEGFDRDNIKNLYTNNVEILGSEWHVEYLFYDPIKNSENKSLSNQAKVVGFRFELQESPDTWWVSEEHGSAIFYNVLNFLETKYGLNSKKVKDILQKNDKSYYTQVKLDDISFTFSKGEGNKTINSQNRQLILGGFDAQIHWYYFFMIHKPGDFSKSATF